jgi:hypothetical protein
MRALPPDIDDTERHLTPSRPSPRFTAILDGLGFLKSQLARLPRAACGG